MKSILFFSGLILSSQSLGQPIRQQNKTLEEQITVQKRMVDSLFGLQSVMNDSIYGVRDLNQALIESLLKLYSDTEEKKFEFHKKINETNDRLIDWKLFYRYEDVSLQELTRFQGELREQPAGISVIMDGLSPFLAARKRMTAKEQNEFLKQQLKFSSGLKISLESTIDQLKEQLTSKQADHAKLISWQGTIEKTLDYCVGKSGSAPFTVNETKLYKCGTVEIEEMLVDTIRQRTATEEDFLKLPEFPGGFPALRSYLTRFVEFHDTQIKGYVKFIITDNGEIRSAKVTRTSDDCPECEKKALEIIRNMPRWNPATKGGHPVSFEYSLFVRIN